MEDVVAGDLTGDCDLGYRQSIWENDHSLLIKTYVITSACIILESPVQERHGCTGMQQNSAKVRNAGACDVRDKSEN